MSLSRESAFESETNVLGVAYPAGSRVQRLHLDQGNPSSSDDCDYGDYPDRPASSEFGHSVLSQGLWGELNSEESPREAARGLLAAGDRGPRGGSFLVGVPASAPILIRARADICA